MRVLVTGGCGFIGSHQIVALLDAGHQVCSIDDLSNASPDVNGRIADITDTSALEFHELSTLDTEALTDRTVEFAPDAIMHFAGFKHVWESTRRSLDYHHNNVGGLVSVLAAAERAGTRKLIFSSSGSIYGETDQLPIAESAAHRPTNPYSTSKSICESILADICRHDPRWSATSLRYFNPAGAHPSGLLGENPLGPPSNLVPALIRAATSPNPRAVVNGDDFNTPDGSGIRDYVHVMDVAEAHLRALEQMGDGAGFVALNVGRGEGVSVYEMIAAVERASQTEFEVIVGPRRPGDVSALYGDTTNTEATLGPIPYRGLSEICDDAWRWESKQRPEPETA